MLINHPECDLLLNLNNYYMNRLTFLFILVFCFAGFVHAQDGEKIRSIGVFFSSLDNFGLRYKFGNHNRLFRITALHLFMNDTEYPSGSFSKITSAGAGLNFGVEIPISLTDQFDFFYGGQIGVNYGYRRFVASTITREQNLGANGGLIAGFNFHTKSSIVFSIEIVPSFSYFRHKSESFKSDSFAIDINNSWAGITIAYTFTR